MVSARLTAQQKALLLCQHLQDGVPLTRLAEHAGIPERTLRRWATTYRADGTVDSLERRRRSDAGQRRLYSDHGSDFTSSRLERVCLDTHVSLIHSRIGVPQGRGKIERLFRTITTELLPHLPGYIPHGTGGQPTTPPQLTLAELDSAVERFVVEEYHSRPHSETRQPPVVRWLADGWIPRSPAHPEDLDTLLLTAATSRIVQRDGIRFSGTRYISPVLAAYVGESVTIRYDPRDAAEVRVYYCDKYLCRAIAPELAREAVTLEQLQDARVARRRALKKELRERRSLADALPADHHYAVVQPAGLPGVDGQRPPAEPPVPRHRLRTYAND